MLCPSISIQCNSQEDYSSGTRGGLGNSWDFGKSLPSCKCLLSGLLFYTKVKQLLITTSFFCSETHKGRATYPTSPTPEPPSARVERENGFFYTNYTGPSPDVFETRFRKKMMDRGFFFSWQLRLERPVVYFISSTKLVLLTLYSYWNFFVSTYCRFLFYYLLLKEMLKFFVGSWSPPKTLY